MMSSAWRISTAGSERGEVVYLGLGTNLGDRRANLAAALSLLDDCVQIDRISSVYETEPVGPGTQPDYWNLAVRGRADQEPSRLLDLLKTIEVQVGRTPSERWGPRIIDIDILLYGSLVCTTPDLVIPHARMMERAFVLVPLAELEPALAHPESGERVLDRLSTKTFERVRRLFHGTELLAEPGESG